MTTNDKKDNFKIAQKITVNLIVSLHAELAKYDKKYLDSQTLIVILAGLSSFYLTIVHTHIKDPKKRKIFTEMFCAYIQATCIDETNDESKR